MTAPPLAGIDAQVESATGLIVAWGTFPDGVPPGSTGLEIRPVPAAEVAKLEQPGVKTMAADGTITVTPPPPPPIVYAGLRPIDEPPLRTTDDQPHEVLRFVTFPQHVYRTTVRVSAIDAGNGTTRDSEVRMVFKGLAASLAQVGTTVVISNMQDTAAAPWRIQAAPQGTDLVISVTGALGRTIDWKLTGDVGTFAPAGLAEE